MAEQVNAELQKAIDATGINEGVEPAGAEPEVTEPTEEKVETKVETKVTEEEAEDETEEETETKEDEKEEVSKTNPPAKNRSPLKAAFTQINELRSNQKAMTTALTDLTAAIKDLRSDPSKETKQEVKESVEGLIAKAKASGADANWLKQFASTIREEMKGEFEKELNPLKEALSKTDKTATELSQAKAVVDRLKAEQATFTDEWTGFVPELQKAYPNATPDMLADAKAEMRKLASSKEYGGESLDGTENKGKQPMPLDYILYKEKAKFETLLKVKSGKSGATGSRTVNEDDGEEEEVSLDPETMTPEKFKKYERQKAKHYEPSPIEILN